MTFAVPVGQRTSAIMNIRNWESRQTRLAWGTGAGNPAFMVLACLIVNLITIIIAIIFSLLVTNDGYNDYSRGYELPILRIS